MRFFGVSFIVLILAIVATALGGRVTGAPVGLWITLEIFLLVLAGLLFMLIGPAPGKMLVVAQAAYRETVRQPLFWFLLVIFSVVMLFLPFPPYFTFGEDLKMMKDMALNTILVATLILTIFTASITIAEEIEGRTAITLLSKPISRRQFLLGKFFGILFAALLLAVVLTFLMGWAINFKYDLDKMDRPADPPEIVALQSQLTFVPGFVVKVIRYVLLVFAEMQLIAPGVILSLCQVMILTSVAVALATRLPMVVNLVACLVVFFVGRLTHVLEAKAENPLIIFVAQVFGTILPALNFYDLAPAIVSEVDVPWLGYVFPAVGLGLIYSVIALLFGLILFEDRDLA